MKIALIAHDKKKNEIIELAKKYQVLKNAPTKITEEDIKPLRKQLRKYILNNDTPEVRELLKTVIEQVTIDDENVTITMHVA